MNFKAFLANPQFQVTLLGGSRRFSGFQILNRFQMETCLFPISFQQEWRCQNRNGAESHGRRAHPRLQFKAPWWKNAGCHGNTHQVVATGECEIQPDSIHSFAGQIKAADHIQQVVLLETWNFIFKGAFAKTKKSNYPYQDDVSSLHSHVSSRSNGDANISLCKGWRVVDAISHHGNLRKKCFIYLAQEKWHLTLWPFSCSFRIFATLWDGKTSAKTLLMPVCLAIVAAVFLLSPVSNTTSIPILFKV